MSLPAPTNFGDYLVFVDESGDHGLASVDPGYPIFVLAFCLFAKSDYVERTGPALQRLKFWFWGHDAGSVGRGERQENCSASWAYHQLGFRDLYP